ncbi:MAG TPA: FAD binding domain-containing protein [Anaerolineae bacterium]|nr:FAD binding domain-containing protein [Anaerolineae bacterium]HQH37681.1 FAD binding domain-containing protein [Anaerolineae bacterium]
MALWDVYYTVTNLDDAVRLLREHKEKARIMAGGTDLIVEMQNKVRLPSALIDVTRVGGLDEIRLGHDGLIHVGPTTTHAQAAASPLIQERALPLAQACWGVGAPALRNRGTIIGNLVTASPANDTITALRALQASLVLRSERGQRIVPLADFYTGVRRTVMEPDEMVIDLTFAPLNADQRGIYLKLGLRRILAIAVTNVAMVLTLDQAHNVAEARIALGSVAPTIIRVPKAEAVLKGAPLTPERIAEAARQAEQSTCPIDDVRGSAWFRTEEVGVLVQRGLEAIRAGETRLNLPVPEALVRLGEKAKRSPHLCGPTIAHHAGGDEPIQCVVNGENVSVQGANDTTLLRMLRDDLGLTGTKVGCEEGECGACTVWLDGMATLACLTPAPRAHGARITTIEGLSQNGDLHPVQKAFIEEDAVQCGYCTPGFVMSAAKLLDEMPNPTREQIKTALSGNLCRCTGYYKIIRAVEKAAAKGR